jgi:hypothetical protein
MAVEKLAPVVAIFPDLGMAEAAVDELWHAGFQKEQIGLAARGEILHQANTASEATEEKAVEGASVGAFAGTAFGAVAGVLAVAFVPGLGPIVAGGLLWGLVGGAAAGAALGTFAGPFIAMGVSEQDAHRYETEFRAGRTIVVVRTEDRQEDAWTILRNHNPVQAERAGQPMLTVSP